MENRNHKNAGGQKQMDRQQNQSGTRNQSQNQSTRAGYDATGSTRGQSSEDTARDDQ